MAKVRSWAGLDVHASKVIACVVDTESGEMSVHRLPGETAAVAAFCAGLPGPTRVAYEAGPTGFGLARALTAAGIECVVAAPGKIERPAQDRVKTDARDAERLVRLLMISALHPVRVPTVADEALRDLVRARDDLRGDLMRARHRLSKLLLRHDVRYEDSASRWSERHRTWLAKVDLGEPGAQLTHMSYKDGELRHAYMRVELYEAMTVEQPENQEVEQPLAEARERLADLREHASRDQG